MVVCGVERENCNLLRGCRDDLAEQLPLSYGTAQFGIEQYAERERDCGHARFAWSDFHCVFHDVVLVLGFLVCGDCDGIWVSLPSCFVVKLICAAAIRESSMTNKVISPVAI